MYATDTEDVLPLVMNFVFCKRCGRLVLINNFCECEVIYYEKSNQPIMEQKSSGKFC